MIMPEKWLAFFQKVFVYYFFFTKITDTRKHHQFCADLQLTVTNQETDKKKKSTDFCHLQLSSI